MLFGSSPSMSAFLTPVQMSADGYCVPDPRTILDTSLSSLWNANRCQPLTLQGLYGLVAGTLANKDRWFTSAMSDASGTISDLGYRVVLLLLTPVVIVFVVLIMLLSTLATTGPPTAGRLIAVALIVIVVLAVVLVQLRQDIVSTLNSLSSTLPNQLSSQLTRSAPQITTSVLSAQVGAYCSSSLPPLEPCTSVSCRNNSPVCEAATGYVDIPGHRITFR